MYCKLQYKMAFGRSKIGSKKRHVASGRSKIGSKKRHAGVKLASSKHLDTENRKIRKMVVVKMGDTVLTPHRRRPKRPLGRDKGRGIKKST